MSQQLGLDEALVTVNKSLLRGSVEVYWRLEECFGCPLEKLTSLAAGDLSDFVISTKRPLKLEFRAADSNPLCRLDSPDLNSHGHYKVELPAPPPNETSPQCNLKELDAGDCMLCPAALFACLLIMVTLGEKLYTKLRRQRHGRGDKLDSEASSTGGPGEHTSGSTSDALSEVPLDGAPRERLVALDAFRGLAIAGMIMVNYGGAGYAVLDHAAWDGITLADFVFPFFVFATGASVAFSTRLASRRDSSLAQCLWPVARRAITLVLIGVCLNSIKLGAEADMDKLRLSGVLQRLGLSYLAVASTYLAELKMNQRLSRSATAGYRVSLVPKLLGAALELALALIMLGLYLFVSFQLEYSDTCPAGYLGPGGATEGGRYAECTGGAAAWLDRLVLGDSHLYQDAELKRIFRTQATHDPEGLLGYTTSILLCLFGLQAGKILALFRRHRSRLAQLIACSACLSVSCVAVLRIPINKRLWSLTFVTVTGSSAFAALALLYLLTDVYKWREMLPLRLLVSAGRNSLLLYLGHSLLHHALPWYFAVDSSSHLQLLLRLAWATFLWLLVAHRMAARGLFVHV